MVASILSDEAALTRQHPNGPRCVSSGSDLKEVPGVVGRKGYVLSAIVKIIVEMFDFLITCKEVH